MCIMMCASHARPPLYPRPGRDFVGSFDDIDCRRNRMNLVEDKFGPLLFFFLLYYPPLFLSTAAETIIHSVFAPVTKEQSIVRGPPKNSTRKNGTIIALMPNDTAMRLRAHS
jgi:hypothetical protein